MSPAARNAILVLLALFLAGLVLVAAGAGRDHQHAGRAVLYRHRRIAVAKAPPGALIVDGPTPAFIMYPYLFYPIGYTSRVIGAIARGYPAST